MPSRISFNEGNHQYRLQGYRYAVPSVTALVGALHRFDNDDWVMGEVAGALADRWDDIAAEPPTSRRARIKQCALNERARDFEFGRAVHHYAETLWTGEPVEVPDMYAGHVQALARWWAAEKPAFIAAEQIVYADADDDYELSAYAGTFDLLLRHPKRGRGLIDLKTWAPWRKGDVTPQKKQQWAMQLAGYAGAERIQTGPDADDEPMPHCDWAGVLHVGPSDARLWIVPPESRVRADAQFAAARALRWLPKPNMEEAS